MSFAELSEFLTFDFLLSKSVVKERLSTFLFGDCGCKDIVQPKFSRKDVLHDMYGFLIIVDVLAAIENVNGSLAECHPSRSIHGRLSIEHPVTDEPDGVRASFET